MGLLGNTCPFGNYLKELRARKGVSLMKVEEATGISNAYLSQLETGVRRRIPTSNRLNALADYYNVSIQQLLQKAGYLKTGDIKETELIECVDCKSFPNSCGYWKSKHKKHICKGFVPAEEMNLKQTIYALGQMDIRWVRCNSQVVNNAIFFLKHIKKEGGVKL